MSHLSTKWKAAGILQVSCWRFTELKAQSNLEKTNFTQTFHISILYLSVRTQRAQVALQVSVGHELHHHQGRLTFGHHAQQTNLGDENEGFTLP